MCEFVSWIEMPTPGEKPRILFLTAKQIKEWERAKDRPKVPDKSERIGHGAIRLYYGIKAEAGINEECTDFSSPDNFPVSIANAIKAGLMDYAVPDIGLLRAQARAEYGKIRGPAGAEYEKIRAQALAVYEQTRDQAMAEYEKIVDQARAEYEKIRDPARAEYQKITIKAFWGLFRIKKNRAQAWK